jgi:mRNA-degrading endonuclease RelE of RelBE toxin-antitoxin system
LSDDPKRYRITLTPATRRALSEQLPSSPAFAILEFISGPLARKPRHVGTPLRAPFAGQWKANRGEYRVRYRIDEHDGIVYVVDVAYRRDAYRT